MNAMSMLGIVVGDSIKNQGYEENGEHRKTRRLVIGLPIDRFVVLDVDSQHGLQRFNDELESKTLNGNIFAYVRTDKGVLLVCDVKKAGTVDYESDARYERISQKRKIYFMHCLSKVTGMRRVMVLCDSDSATEEQRLLVATWNMLAGYAEDLGPWREAIKQVDSDQ